jgi:ubiquinone/menaquinone biosynthesis C-methylase UbiE
VIGWLYDFLGERSERGGTAERRRELLASLEGEVIEIGAGTGRSLPHYDRAKRVVAIEPDENMAKRIERRLPDVRVPVEVVSASAEALPFPDESFDAAVAAFVLCTIPHPARALAEIRRVLRPSGRLALLEHVRGSEGLASWQDRLTPLHKRIAGGCHLNRDTLATVARAGFDVTEVERVSLSEPIALYRPGIQGVAIRMSS